MGSFSFPVADLTTGLIGSRPPVTAEREEQPAEQVVTAACAQRVALTVLPWLGQMRTARLLPSSAFSAHGLWGLVLIVRGHRAITSWFPVPLRRALRIARTRASWHCSAPGVERVVALDGEDVSLAVLALADRGEDGNSDGSTVKLAVRE